MQRHRARERGVVRGGVARRRAFSVGFSAVMWSLGWLLLAAMITSPPADAAPSQHVTKKPRANKGRKHETATREAAWTALQRGCALNPDLDPEDPKELHTKEGIAVLRARSRSVAIYRSTAVARSSTVLLEAI